MPPDSAPAVTPGERLTLLSWFVCGAPEPAAARAAGSERNACGILPQSTPDDLA
jgi:hypothetical protein